MNSAGPGLPVDSVAFQYVCLSVDTGLPGTQKLLFNSLLNFTQWLNIIQGPID